MHRKRKHRGAQRRRQPRLFYPRFRWHRRCSRSARIARNRIPLPPPFILQFCFSIYYRPCCTSPEYAGRMPLVHSVPCVQGISSLVTETGKTTTGGHSPFWLPAAGYTLVRSSCEPCNWAKRQLFLSVLPERQIQTCNKIPKRKPCLPMVWQASKRMASQMPFQDSSFFYWLCL